MKEFDNYAAKVISLNGGKPVSQPAQARSQFPILGVLGLIFITLKLTGHIAWSWWWVLAPFWLPIAIVLGVLIVVLIVAGIAAALK